MGGRSRREFLGGAAAVVGVGGLSGCVTGGRLRRYRVVNEPVPAGLDASVAAEAVAGPTRNAPLRVRISFTATADRRTAYSIGSAGEFPFGEVTATGRRGDTDTGSTGASERNRMIVVPVDEPSAFVDQCWRRRPGSTQTDADGGALVRLEPEESITVERAIVNHPDNPACYPFGRYAFSDSFWVGSAAHDRAPADAIDWGFTLQINDLMTR